MAWFVKIYDRGKVFTMRAEDYAHQSETELSDDAQVGLFFIDDCDIWGTDEECA